MRFKLQGRVAEGHGRKNRLVLRALWPICYLGVGKWELSLSLVKHDTLPRPSARRWLKFTLPCLGRKVAEAALFKQMGWEVTAQWPPQAWLNIVSILPPTAAPKHIIVAYFWGLWGQRCLDTENSLKLTGLWDNCPADCPGYYRLFALSLAPVCLFVCLFSGS